MNPTVNGDLNDLIDRGWKNHRALSQAPALLKPAAEGVLSLVGLLHLTQYVVQETELSATDRWVINGQKEACSLALSQLESALANLRSRRLTLEDVAGIKDKFQDQVAKLSSFLDILHSNSTQKILTALSQIPTIKDRPLDWEFVQGELQKSGFSSDILQENFFSIDHWLSENLSQDAESINAYETSEAPSAPRSISGRDEADELPGYTPGAKRGTIEEKVQSLEQTTMAMNLGASAQDMASSSKAAPPAYTFEAGQDEQLDQDFTKYIEDAVHTEASRRSIERSQYPDTAPHPYGWLPKAMHSQYRSRDDIIPMLDAQSFSTMAFETGPRCNQEIDRLTSLMRASFEHGKLSQTDQVIRDATRCSETISEAISKFMFLQDQHAITQTFSDLDSLDFECSTANGTDTGRPFPTKEFDFCQKSYYRLITYIMGLLEVYAYIFQGGTYINRSRHELEILWKDKKMNIRTAWIEKQLTGWSEVEQAVIYLRDWRGLRPAIRDQAFQALKEWQQAERMLSGSDIEDVIELTVISASNIPKSGFNRPTPLVKIVGFVATKIGGQMRAFELRTDYAQKSQNPVWNKTFKIKIPRHTRSIHLEIADRVAGMESSIGKVKLNFSFIPGVEANFARKSLMYGYDEEVEYPLELALNKTKEKETAMLKLALKWAGRQAKLEEAMISFTPPGKMFKTNPGLIPLSTEEREAQKKSQSKYVPPGLSNSGDTTFFGGNVIESHQQRHHHHSGMANVSASASFNGSSSASGF